MSWRSNCCGAEDGMARYDGPSWSDIGICPNCRDHCEFENDEEETTENPTIEASNATSNSTSETKT
jgi:hypothetical protein